MTPMALGLEGRRTQYHVEFDIKIILQMGQDTIKVSQPAPSNVIPSLPVAGRAVRPGCLPAVL